MATERKALSFDLVLPYVQLGVQLRHKSDLQNVISNIVHLYSPVKSSPHWRRNRIRFCRIRQSRFRRQHCRATKLNSRKWIFSSHGHGDEKSINDLSKWRTRKTLI